MPVQSGGDGERLSGMKRPGDRQEALLSMVHRDGAIWLARRAGIQYCPADAMPPLCQPGIDDLTILYRSLITDRGRVAGETYAL